jgi:hypothetical protein
VIDESTNESQVDIPKQLNQMKLALRVAFFPFDLSTSLASSSTTAHVRSLQAPVAPVGDVCLGGTLQVEFFYLAAPPKAIKTSWVMRPSNINQGNFNLLCR